MNYKTVSRPTYQVYNGNSYTKKTVYSKWILALTNDSYKIIRSPRRSETKQWMIYINRNYSLFLISRKPFHKLTLVVNNWQAHLRQGLWFSVLNMNIDAACHVDFDVVMIDQYTSATIHIADIMQPLKHALGFVLFVLVWLHKLSW